MANCGCNETITTSSECPEFSVECPNMINTECIILSVDLPIIDVSAGEGLDTALEAMDTLLATSMVQVKVTIPSASIKLLNGTPYTLLLSPGSGKFYQILGLTMKMDSGATVYTVAGGNLQIKTTNATNPAYIISDSILTTVNTAIVNTPIFNTTGVDTMRTNEALIIRHSSGNPTLGDGDLAVFITYVIKTA